MHWIERLRRALLYEDLSHCPDYKDILDHLELAEDDDPETIREAVEDAVADGENDTEGGDDAVE